MIDIVELAKDYTTSQGSVKAVRGISYHIPRGSFFSLLGPSGCGKSTTLRMIAGLERPNSGEIRINDKIVYSSRERIYIPTNKRTIGMVFQSYAIWPHMTVKGNVAYPLKVQRVARGEIDALVRRALAIVGLEGLEMRDATRLSGGQQQRVALARAIVAEPDVLLLDEPLSNLDAKLRKEMRAELKRLQREIGITTIYVTHDQEEALSLSDEIAVMETGQIRQRGAPYAIYHQPVHRFVAEFIGSANILEGEIDVSSSGDVVTTPLGALRVSTGANIKSGKVFVCIRPELTELLEAAPVPHDECANTVEGTVESVDFLGQESECQVRVLTELLKVKVKSNAQLERGKRVRVRLPWEHCHVLARDERRAGIRKFDGQGEIN